MRATRKRVHSGRAYTDLREVIHEGIHSDRVDISNRHDRESFRLWLKKVHYLPEHSHMAFILEKAGKKQRIYRIKVEGLKDQIVLELEKDEDGWFVVGARPV